MLTLLWPNTSSEKTPDHISIILLSTANRRLVARDVFKTNGTEKGNESPAKGKS